MKNLIYVWVLSLFIFSCGGGEDQPNQEEAGTNTTEISSGGDQDNPESMTEEGDDSEKKDVDLEEENTEYTEESSTSSTTSSTTEIKKEESSTTTTTSTTTKESNTSGNNTSTKSNTTSNTSSNTNSNTTTNTKSNSTTNTKSNTKKSGGTTKSGGTKPNPVNLSHDVWNQLMEKYVSASGNVNYAGLKGKKSVIDGYLTHLGTHPPKSSWSKNKEMAYWINMYNAFTISLILNKYPINSIMELRGGKVWMTEQILVAGKAYTLEQIEKNMLLKKFGDARIHFAVNCAAKSCPPLHNGAWTESNIQKLLDKKARDFINNSTYNTIAKKKVTISKIFEWYAGDFGGKGNLVNYLNKYSNTQIKSNASVSFNEYNWNLNK